MSTAPTCESPVGQRQHRARHIVTALFAGYTVFVGLQCRHEQPFARDWTRAGACENNLHQVGLSLYNYHDEHGAFPPVRTVGAGGKPLHSWRTLLLPFLEYRPLYEKTRLDEPWDGKNNRILRESIRVYQCPSKESEFGTQYVAVIGRSTAWHATTGTKLSEIRDDHASTILVVETAASPPNWFEPRDLTVDQLIAGLNDPEFPTLANRHVARPRWFWQEADRSYRYTNVFMADGSLRRIPADTSPEALRAMLTINGGENVDIDAICNLPDRYESMLPALYTGWLLLFCVWLRLVLVRPFGQRLIGNPEHGGEHMIDMF